MDTSLKSTLMYALAMAIQHEDDDFTKQQLIAAEDAVLEMLQ